MQKHFFLFYLIISCFTVKGQQCKMYLTINPLQCAACNTYLHNLKNLDSGIDVILVFKEEFKPEKEYLETQLAIKHLNLSFLWSDSLYNKLIVKGSISSATFVSSDGNHFHKQSLQLLNSESGFINFCNTQGSQLDTIKFKYKFISPGVRNFIYKNFEFYVIDNLRDQVRIHSNLGDFEEMETIQLTDDMVKKGFKLKFNSLDQYELSKKLIKDLKVPKPHSIIAIQPEYGLIYIMTEYGYFYFENQNQDTILSSFYTLNVFKGGKFSQSYLIDGNFEKGGINGHYCIARNFKLKDKKLYMGMVRYGNYTKDTTYFLASYQLNPNTNTFSFQEFLPYSLPNTYVGYENNFLDINFWGSYSALGLVDRLYNLDKKEVIDLNIFPDIQMIDNNNLTYHKYIYNFKLDDHYVYLNYYDFPSKQYFYLKYDRMHQKEIFKIKLFTDLELNASPVIDPNDFNYVIIPVAKNVLIRKKMTQP